MNRHCMTDEVLFDYLTYPDEVLNCQHILFTLQLNFHCTAFIVVIELCWGFFSSSSSLPQFSLEELRTSNSDINHKGRGKEKMARQIFNNPQSCQLEGENLCVLER